MELPRDPGSLLRDGDARCGLALSLRLRGARLGCVGLFGAGVERESPEPGHPEDERDEHELRRRGGGGAGGGMNTSARGEWPGRLRMIVAMLARTTARPTRARTTSRRLPSRNAASIP